MGLPKHELRLRVSPKHLDELEHVSNVVYLEWILDVARAHSDAAGYERAAYQALGGVFVVRRHEIDYLRSAAVGDDILMTTWVESWKAASCLRRTEVTTPGRDVVYASAATRWAYVSLDSRRPQRIPEALRAAFEAG